MKEKIIEVKLKINNTVKVITFFGEPCWLIKSLEFGCYAKVLEYKIINN